MGSRRYAPLYETPASSLPGNTLPETVSTPKFGARSQTEPIATLLKKAQLPCTPSSMDSGLEAFSHNPADDSVAPLAARQRAHTNYPVELFLSY